MVLSARCQERVLVPVQEDRAGGCRGAHGRDADVRSWKDRAGPGFLFSRAFLPQFLSSPPVPLISGSWFGLASLFPVSGSFSFLLFFSCASPADLVWIPGSQLAI